jgi:hypothetical protein
MATVDDLLSKIAAFCKDVGISEATFATRAVNDGKFVGRLRNGAGITIKTIDRVHAYIAAEREQLGKPEQPAATPSPEEATVVTRKRGRSASFPGGASPRRKAA